MSATAVCFQNAIPRGLGSAGGIHISTTPASYQPLGTASGVLDFKVLIGQQVLISTDNATAGFYLNNEMDLLTHSFKLFLTLVLSLSVVMLQCFCSLTVTCPQLLEDPL